MFMKFKNINALDLNLTLSLSFNFKLYSTTVTHLVNPKPTEPLTKTQLKALVLSHYSSGHFSSLFRNVVSSPSVLLTASVNLFKTDTNTHNSVLSTVSKHFSVQQMSQDLMENRFDIGSCSVKMSNNKKGDSLLLPNLKLKVLIEAIRIVLEIVYDERFVTFSYGGRVNMGRHTAIRYLKNSVENPSWWFTVSFNREKLDNCKVDKLCSFMGEKIKDEMLVNMIKRLFDYDILRIELGGCYLGRGLPQECGLSSILINIYFDGFDRELQETRLRINEKTPEFVSNALGTTYNVSFKPIKIYAVRYLDEILVITSGSKMLTVDLKNAALKFLEENLELKIDKLKTVLHSAVSERIDFLGMELQAVTPSVLHPSMSEKAIRARKKYIRQKEVRSLELRNARERNRKKLGLKLLSHVFKKSKQSNGCKFEVHIENDVNDIFKSWADEVVREFLGSLDERWTWHRMLTRGDFLSLRHIRDQLPEELIDAYDKFQEQVDKHLSPVKARQALEEEERRQEEEEQRKYAERSVEDLRRLCMKVSAPIELIRKAVKMAGFTNHMGRPRPISLLTAMEDTDIIMWYAGVGRRWLDFFCCCHNFKMVKTVVTYHLRFSCILTLAEKHESTKLEAIRHYTKDLKVTDMEGNEEVYFPTEREVKMMGDKNLSDPKPVDGALSLALIRLAVNEPLHPCATQFCNSTDTIMYRVRLLQSHLNVNPLDEKKWVQGMSSIPEAMNRKCIALCSVHKDDFFMGKLTLQDIDCTLLVEVD